MVTVPMTNRVHHFNVLEALLESGIAPYKMEQKKFLMQLEKGCGKLTSSSKLVATYLHPILQKEFKTSSSRRVGRLTAVKRDMMLHYCHYTSFFC